MLIFFAFFLSGASLTAFAIWMLHKRRILVATVNGSAGISLISISIILALIFLNVHTYNQLTSEQKLAEIHIGKKTEAGIPVKLLIEQREHIFYINAKEWQLDARFLKWKSWAYLLGSEPVVRLESLTERHPFRPVSVPVSHKLPTEHPFLTDLGASFSHWFGIVDTYYGSAVYMPAVEGSSYSVSATVSGLIARAENQQSHDAVSQWMNQ